MVGGNESDWSIYLWLVHRDIMIQVGDCISTLEECYGSCLTIHRFYGYILLNQLCFRVPPFSECMFSLV